MDDYFYYLSENILDKKSKDLLLEFVNHDEQVQNFRYYKTLTGRIDNNIVLSRYTPLNEHPVVKKLINACVLNTFPVIMKHLPGAIVDKHADDSPQRTTLLMFPLYPIKNYPPTYFYKNLEDSVPLLEVNFPNMAECLFNTRRIHGLINTSSHERINLQLCFQESFNDVKKLILENKLFNKQL